MGRRGRDDDGGAVEDGVLDVIKLLGKGGCDVVVVVVVVVDDDCEPPPLPLLLPQPLTKTFNKLFICLDLDS